MQVRIFCFIFEPTKTIKTTNMENKPKYIKCIDKFENELKVGDSVDVQMVGECQIYTKLDGQLYFKPYGVEERVSSYFMNDLIKVEKKPEIMVVRFNENQMVLMSGILIVGYVNLVKNDIIFIEDYSIEDFDNIHAIQGFNIINKSGTKLEVSEI